MCITCSFKYLMPEYIGGAVKANASTISQIILIIFFTIEYPCSLCSHTFPSTPISEWQPVCMELYSPWDWEGWWQDKSWQSLVAMLLWCQMSATVVEQGLVQPHASYCIKITNNSGNHIQIKQKGWKVVNLIYYIGCHMSPSIQLTCIHIHTCIHTHTRIRTHTRTHACTHTRTRTHIW